MQSYACHDCKKVFDGKALYVCPDDKLRCGPCRKLAPDLEAAWYTLYDLEQQDDMKTLEVRALREARRIVTERIKSKDEKAASPTTDTDGSLQHSQPTT